MPSEPIPSGRRAQASAGRPVLATSLNPFGRLAHERRAFAAWAALGFETLTFNEAGESARLAAAGVPEEARVVLAPQETAASLFGKPLPRVAPVLARLAATRPGRTVLLVNADIVPAMGSLAPIDLWLANAPAVALTREDCDLAETHDPAVPAPYRNGLDAFLFSPAALGAANRALFGLPVAARMTFGVPGWDFLLGALVRSPAIGGRILDGAVILHERHAQTYSNVDEFAHYVPAMRALGETRAATAEGAAADFFGAIVASASAGAALSTLARRVAFRRPPPLPASERALSAVALVLRAAPPPSLPADAFALAALAERCVRGEADLARLRAVLSGHGRVTDAFAGELAALLLLFAAAGPPPLVPGRAPPLALRAAGEGRDPLKRRLRLVRLWGDLLVRVTADAALAEAVALAASSDAERALIRTLHTLLAAAVPPATLPMARAS
jgi:hypothetical protein